MEEKIKEQEETDNKKEKKNNTLGVILISFLIVGLSVACGWFLNSYFNNSRLSTNQSKIENNDQEDLSDNNKSLEEEDNNQEDLSGNNKSSEKENNAKDVTENQQNNKRENLPSSKGKPVIAAGNNRKVGLFDENLNLVWSHNTSDYIPYGDITVNGNYIYYAVRESGSDSTMIANLYRVNIEKLKVENLNIKLNYPWNLSIVNNNQLFYSSLYDYHIVNLDNKKDELLEIQGNNREEVINEKLLYTKKDEGSLYIYNLKTKEDKKVADDARIVQRSYNYIMYVTNWDNKYYLYDVINNKSTYLYQSTSSGTIINNSNMGNIIDTLFKDTLYIVSGKSLYTLKNNKLNKIYELSLKDNESIIKLTLINSEKIFMTKFISEGDNCSKSVDICGPIGKDDYFILDVNQKKEYNINSNLSDWLEIGNNDIEYVNS